MCGLCVACECVCVCMCVCVCVCARVCVSRGDHFPMHCIATTVKEVKILTFDVPVGPLLILWLKVCTKGREVAPMWTVVTTVTGNQIVTIVSGQDMDYVSGWLMDKAPQNSLSISPVICRLVNQVALCYLALSFTSILHPNTHSYGFEEHACDVHVLRKWQGYFRISEFEITAACYSSF